MKNTKVTLVSLMADDREQFILDNQWAFKHGSDEGPDEMFRFLKVMK